MIYTINWSMPIEAEGVKQLEYTLRRDNLFEISNRPIYAFAFKDERHDIFLDCKPVKGEIVNGCYFYEYKKDGTLKRSGEVRALSRCYADTYEEAVWGYNYLIDEKVRKLRAKADTLQSKKIGRGRNET